MTDTNTYFKELFGEHMRENESLSRHTTARVGGPADLFLEADSPDALAKMTAACWELNLPYLILGGGSNVLVSDAGVRGAVILNRARQVRFDQGGEHPTVWAESGANLSSLARQAALRGLCGLEWAAGIPGTVGGAVVGNAGAHGFDMGNHLMMAEILHRIPLAGMSRIEFMKEQWPVERFEYVYRSSLIKRQRHNPLSGRYVVLVVLMRLDRSDAAACKQKMESFAEHRRRTQPSGATMGSMFKNPPGDYAGRLIEAAGLKGTVIGDAEISPLHANFFVNRGKATAADIYALVDQARTRVAEQFGINLELEIELIGEWDQDNTRLSIEGAG